MSRLHISRSVEALWLHCVDEGIHAWKNEKEKKILIVTDNQYYYFSIITAFRVLKVLGKVFFKQNH